MGKLSNNDSGFGALEGLLVLVILGIVGFTGWYVYNAHTKTNATLAATTQENTATAPKFGTKGKTQSSPSASSIIAAVKSDCESTPGSTAGQITITKQEGNYASATVVCTSAQFSPTSRVYLKNSNGTWSIVLRGGGAPTTSDDLKPFGFPSDFLN